MSENEAGTWQRRPFVISPWKGSVFVGGWLPDHASTPCVKLKPENHEPLQKQKCTEVPDRSFTSVQMVHTHTTLPHTTFVLIDPPPPPSFFLPAPSRFNFCFWFLEKVDLWGYPVLSLRKSRRITLFWTCQSPLLKEVLQNCFVLTGTLKEV